MDIDCVGAVIRDATGRIVVIKRLHPPSKGLWSLPGGRIEAGETPEDAVRREVLEETGLRVEPLAVAGSVVLPALRAEDRYVVTDFFATVAPGTSTRPIAGDDAAEARWVSHGELEALELTDGLASTLESWQVWAR